MIYLIFVLWSLSNFILFPHTETAHRLWEINTPKIDTSIIDQLHNDFEQYRNDSPDMAEKVILEAIEMAKKADDKRVLVKGYNLYGDFLRIQSREDSAIVIIKISLKLASTLDFQSGQSDALVSLGNCYWQKGDFQKSMEYQNQNIKLARKMGDSVRVAQSYIGLGGIHSQKGGYTRAMEYNVLASKRFLESRNMWGYKVALGNIGFIQRNLENYDSAIEYFKKSDSLSTVLRDPSGRAFASYNLSVVYKNTGRLDSAYLYNQKSLEIYDQLGNRKRVSYCLFTMGEIQKKRENFREALNSYLKSLTISRAVDDSVQIGYSSMAVADMYDRLNDLEKSISYLENAAKVASEMKLDILAMDVHERLARRHEKAGDMGSAYHNLQKFVHLKDSLYTREKRELGSEIEAKYQNEQKAKEIALLASEKDLQRLQLRKRVNERNVIIVLAILAVVIAGLLYNQYRIKQRSNKELRELDELKSNFFANISHEFRTPLTLIKGPIEELEQNPGEPLSRENARMIRRNANRVLGLVDQLLDISKIDRGKLKLQPTEGDVYKCLRAAAFAFNSHAAQHHMDYRVNIPDEMLWAAFDRDKLEKIAYNLLSNAFKFSRDGDMVSFTADYVHCELDLQVMDSGMGIPEERLPFIFDRFYQVDGGATRETEGSGIGLSLSRELVVLMDGTITVSSEEQKGSFFTVHLPIQKIITEPGGSKKTVKKVRTVPVSRSYRFTKADKRHLQEVLVVEDNTDMRQFLKEQLIKQYKVQEAIDGEDGLRKAILNVPDLIITDLMMPKMDGMEFCQKIKTDRNTSHIPVIMLTAKAGIENKIAGLETGADDYLTKPFEARELMARIKNLIDQRQRLREAFAQRETAVIPKNVSVSSMDQEFLERVLAILDDNFNDPGFGVPDMQRELAMSNTQLHRKLKALTNEAPGELLRNFRLKKAAQLLAQQADSVTRIGYRVGFNNPSYFTKCFKHFYGVVPSSYLSSNSQV